MTHADRGSFSDNKHAAVSPLDLSAFRIRTCWQRCGATLSCAQLEKKHGQFLFLTRTMLRGYEINTVLHICVSQEMGFLHDVLVLAKLQKSVYT